ncbi:MAG: SIMPL domain-containing protein [Alphaproteobacteria bacterium]|nr:SIMPL domain-containing protein [Alphaproteobacteria bacterium]
MSQNNTAPLGIILLGVFIALGLSASGYFVGQMMYNAKVAVNTAEAKGLAERRVEADTANWTLRFDLAGGANANIPALYKQAEKHQQTIISLLKENGFTDDEIKIGVIDYRYQEFRNSSQQLVDQKHILAGSVNVETAKVRQIEKVRGNVNKLIAEGINIQNTPPKYYFTGLNDIKPDMLREATQNARIAANEFASNAGVKVGSIRSARQGSFFIRDVGSEYSDSEKIEKDVRVVTTIDFYLTD